MKGFAAVWAEITSDQWVLRKMKEGCRIEFIGPVQSVGRVRLHPGRCHPVWLAEVQSHTNSSHH